MLTLKGLQLSFPEEAQNLYQLEYDETFSGLPVLIRHFS